MKALFTTVFVVVATIVFAQSVEVQQPIEEQHPINYWWWVLGVLIAIGAGIALYMLIKKDPRKDVVR
jgi:heme/copper-type cytochrome/quinol oxidase subunit 2